MQYQNALSARNHPARPLSANSPPTGDLWYMVQRLVSAVLLIILVPLLAMLYVLVKCTSRGPFIYSQRRPGLHGVPFTAYKIRSMRPGADRDPRLARSVRASNPQVTMVGRVLRDLKLDELPQLWNVVRGDMALVGPRPIAVVLQEELEQKIEGFKRRLSVRPGLTNLGQVCVIESADPDQVVDDWGMRFEAELHYIKNSSPSYDVLIMLVTGLYVLRKALIKLRPGRIRLALTAIVLIMAFNLTGCASTGGAPVIFDSAEVSTQRVGSKNEAKHPPSPSLEYIGISSEPAGPKHTARHPAIEEVQSVSVRTVEQGEPEPQYRVGHGDILGLNVFGEPGMSDLRIPVDADGYIQLPVLERFKVAGKTTGEIQEELKTAYRQEFNAPWVVALVSEFGSRPVYLLGEFNSPGVIYLDRPTNIIQALGHGKGLSTTAYLRGARLLRDNALVPVDINGLLKEGRSDQNLWLESGDTIYVPNKDELKVIVLGAVNQPGAMPFDNEGMGLVEAIARAEDIRRSSAKLDEVRVIRSLSPVSGEFITVDAERIFSGSAPDFPLIPGDIVYVPQTALGNWNDVVNAIIPSFELVVNSLQPFVQLKVLAGLD